MQLARPISLSKLLYCSALMSGSTISHHNCQICILDKRLLFYFPPIQTFSNHRTPTNRSTTSFKLDLEHQKCPFEGAYTIDAPIESDLTYNPSNIFICPRQSYLVAQCDQTSRLRIHSKCSPNKFSIKSKLLIISIYYEGALKK